MIPIFDQKDNRWISKYRTTYKESIMTTATIENKTLHPQFGARKKQKNFTSKRRRAIDWHEKHIGEWGDQKVLAIHQLRCNLASLVAESRIIRKEERRCSLIYAGSLRWHRISDLREELRYTCLALAFIRGRKYSEVENKGSRPVDIDRFAKKVMKFLGMNPASPEFFNWITGSKYVV